MKLHFRIDPTVPGARAPKFAHDGDACFDCYAPQALSVPPRGKATISLGVAFDIPPGHVLKAYSRSGHGFNHSIRLANSVGIIDSGYTGNVAVALHNDGDTPFLVNEGERIIQMMLVSLIVTELDQVGEIAKVTQRGNGGFGSSGA